MVHNQNLYLFEIDQRLLRYVCKNAGIPKTTLQVVIRYEKGLVTIKKVGMNEHIRIYVIFKYGEI